MFWQCHIFHWHLPLEKDPGKNRALPTTKSCRPNKQNSLPPPPEELTFPEDVNEYWDFQTLKFNRTNFEICDTSDGGLDTLIACVKSHISQNEILLWEWKRDCPDTPVDEIPPHLQMQLDQLRKIFAQYENNQVSTQECEVCAIVQGMKWCA